MNKGTNILESVIDSFNGRNNNRSNVLDPVNTAKKIYEITDGYTKLKTKEKEEKIDPPHVDAGDIIAARQSDRREFLDTNIESKPYFTQEEEER